MTLDLQTKIALLIEAGFEFGDESFCTGPLEPVAGGSQALFSPPGTKEVDPEDAYGDLDDRKVFRSIEEFVECIDNAYKYAMSKDMLKT